MVLFYFTLFTLLMIHVHTLSVIAVLLGANDEQKSAEVPARSRHELFVQAVIRHYGFVWTLVTFDLPADTSA
jgi:hypothetical protein